MIVKIKNAPKLWYIEQPVLVGISSLQKLLKFVPVFTSIIMMMIVMGRKSSRQWWWRQHLQPSTSSSLASPSLASETCPKILEAGTELTSAPPLLNIVLIIFGYVVVEFDKKCLVLGNKIQTYIIIKITNHSSSFGIKDSESFLELFLWIFLSHLQRRHIGN